MTCRDGLHPSICLPPTHSKTDIKKRHSTVWFVLNPNCLFPLYFVIYRDCYESRHSIPCMFFHYNCRSSELKNNTWNIRCLEGQMCIRIRVRKGNSLGQYWNHHFKKKKHEEWMLTTNLITTASSVYQHSITVAFRYLSGSWKTLLCPSLVVTCTQVTVGLPHLARL